MPTTETTMTALPGAPSSPSTEAAAAAPARDVDPTLRVTFRRTMRAEWIKLWSVRSNVIGLAAAALVAIVVGLVVASVAGDGAADSGEGGPGVGYGSDTVASFLSGFDMAQLIVGVFGVLLVTSEYATGMIRTTFAAVTRRTMVLWAKAATFGAIVFVGSLVVALVTVAGGSALYGGTDTVPSLTDPDVVRAILGTAAVTAGLGLLGMALGWLLRSAAAGIGVLVAALFLLPPLASLLPDVLADPLTKIMPGNAGAAFSRVLPMDELLSPGAGFAVFLAWVVGLLLVAGAVLRRRDA
jgi:ABC-type transport system involved in multi-copper enzyme maturation permease subunit